MTDDRDAPSTPLKASIVATAHTPQNANATKAPAPATPPRFVLLELLAAGTASVSDTAAHAPSLLQAARTTLALGGVRALYRGLVISSVMTGPANAVYLMSYDVSKRVIGEHTRLVQETPLVHLLSGLIAEMLSGVLWTPMEVIKQRMMVRSSEYTRGAVDALRSVVRNEGGIFLLKGYWTNLWVFAPFSMIYWFSYEQCKRWLSPHPVVKGQPTQQLPFWRYVFSSLVCSALASALTCPIDLLKTRMQYRSMVQSVRKVWREEGGRALWKGLSARVLWISPATTISVSLYEEAKIFLSKEIKR